MIRVNSLSHEDEWKYLSLINDVCLMLWISLSWIYSITSQSLSTQWILILLKYFPSFIQQLLRNNCVHRLTDLFVHAHMSKDTSVQTIFPILLLNPAEMPLLWRSSDGFLLITSFSSSDIYFGKSVAVSKPAQLFLLSDGFGSRMMLASFHRFLCGSSTLSINLSYKPDPA